SLLRIEDAHMPLVVGVTFRRVGKVYYFDPGELELREGDFVIAETARGMEFGEVVIPPREVSDDELVAPLKKICRIATGDDLEREASNREREKQAFEVCERKIAEHNLPMKLLDAECTFDGSQITFSFSAEGRVDFRELVKDVASTLRTKVQLHQIGVRDEAKLIGGYGECGRPLCCATFLSTFEPISMKMAKDQSLFLNPSKFSGLCGKLMCCLRYEHEFYKQAQRRLPAVGAIIELDKGRAKVINVNVITNMLTVETEDEVQLHISADRLNLEGLCRRHGIACNMTEKNCVPLVAGDDTGMVDEVEEEDISDEEEELVADLLDEPSDITLLVDKDVSTEEEAPLTPEPCDIYAQEDNGDRRRREKRFRPRRGNGVQHWREVRDQPKPETRTGD
ncbi:MAG: stage 0 sporulation family protein, partial [Armatimonadetes bacterium]|nr:stage 0 sporulation family protein [Armatimonadota bacterium]